MTRDRFRPDKGFVNHRKLPKGPNDRACCRMCQLELPEKTRRRTFCSEECIRRWKIQTDPSFVRQLIYRRDQGICASCGVDTLKLANKLIDRSKKYGFRGYERFNKLLKRIGWAGWDRNRSPWDADHKVAVMHGGGCCDLNNYVTLCMRCHKAKTREDRRKAVEARKENKAKEVRPVGRR